MKLVITTRDDADDEMHHVLAWHHAVKNSLRNLYVGFALLGGDPTPFQFPVLDMEVSFPGGTDAEPQPAVTHWLRTDIDDPGYDYPRDGNFTQCCSYNYRSLLERGDLVTGRRETATCAGTPKQAQR